MANRSERTARALLDECGRTYAEDAGIELRDTPMPLYRLLVLVHLLSARISADIAIAATRALSDAGLRDARRMADATWQQRVDALGAGGYRRYDERTATQLGEEARLVLDQYHGDLRRMRARGDVRPLLREMPGIGPTGVDIFLREVQGVWPEYAPYVDRRALDGAARLGLPRTPGGLARLVDPDELPRFASGLVRVARSSKAADAVRAAAAARSSARAAA